MRSYFEFSVTTALGNFDFQLCRGGFMTFAIYKT